MTPFTPAERRLTDLLHLLAIVLGVLGIAYAFAFAETERRWSLTTPQWPIMHAVLHGVTRDQMMARHKANHIQVAYGSDAASADRALAVKAAMFDALGVKVHVCGDVKL